MGRVREWVTTDVSTQALPCPWCGHADALLTEGPFVQCRRCDVFGPSGHDDTREAALVAWNTRARLPAQGG